MHYFIDGYNYIFRLFSAGDDLKEQRAEVIEELEIKLETLHLSATVVFDAHYQKGPGSRSHFRSLEICFTEEGETADEYILKSIESSKNPKAETVVTSDNKLAWHARRHFAKTLSVKEFFSLLNSRYQSAVLKKRGREKEGEPLLKKRAAEKPQPPPSKEVIEGSFDYYLYHFEKKRRKAATKEPHPPLKAEKGKRKKLPKEGVKKESDMERWLRIFTDRSEK